MTKESGPKLRTKLESAKTLEFTNSATNATYAEGEMTVIGSTIGVVIENVGTSGAVSSDTYPNGPDGVLVYEAEKIVLSKNTSVDDSFGVGDPVYYSTSDRKVTSVSTGNTLCGRALETVGTAATQVLCDLMVMA